MWTELDSESDEEGGNSGQSEDSEAVRARGGRGWARELWRKFRKRVRRVVKHKYFLWFVLIVHAVNLILLMCLHSPQDPVFDEVIYVLNYVFSLFYVSEFMVRVLSLPRKNYSPDYWKSPLHYWKNSLLLVEGLLCVMTVVDLVVFTPIKLLRDLHINIVLNTIWCLKLIRSFKYTRSWRAMKDILRTLFQLMPSILSLMLLMIIFLCFFAILGMRLFGERLSNTTGIVEPNFDTFGKAFLLVFQLMTSEDWNNVLFTSLDHWIDKHGIYAGGAFAVYFVIGVSFGSFILLVVFLAMSVDKLSEVRSLDSDTAEEQEKRDKKRQEAQQHISDLKGKPQVKRRTIRSAMKYLSDNTTEPITVKQQKKKMRIQLKQNSSRLLSPSTDSFSTPMESRDVSTSPSESPKKKKLPVKLRNPLRLMKQRSEFFEQQKLRMLKIGPKETPNSPVRQTSMEKVQKKLVPKMSLDLLQTSEQVDGPMPFLRTQSSPADTPMPGMKTFSERLESIEEVGGVSNTGYQRQGSSIGLVNDETSHDPNYPSAVDEHLAPALARGSSFQEFNSISEEPIMRQRATSSEHQAAFKIKEKVRSVWKWIKDYVGTIQFDPEKELKEIPNHSSFFILAPHNRFREFCYNVVCSKVFSTLTLVTVFLSSLVLTVEVPLGVSGAAVNSRERFLCSLQRVIFYLDIIFMAYFFIEMALKMIALGVVFHKGSYLRGAFNILDFLILISNIAPIVVAIPSQENRNETRCMAYTYQTNTTALIVLGVFRVLRPLKSIRIRGLYLVVSGLFSSIKSMGSIFFMTMLVLIVFSVTGVLFFRGRFNYCNDPTKTLEQDCRGFYFSYDYTFPGRETGRFPGLPCPMKEERVWDRRGLNFDNIGFAILSLFCMLTIEGWQSVMYHGLNSRPLLPSEVHVPQGQIPGSTTNPLAAVFFIFYMIVMALILVQLFTGFLIVTFQEDGVKTFRETKLDRNQRNCLYFALNAKPVRQYVPKFELHKKFHHRMLPVVNHPLSKFTIILALITNIIFLALVKYGNEQLNQHIYYINIFFTTFFALEALIKIIVLTPPNYFGNVENVFDFLIVIATILELIIQIAVPSIAMGRYKCSLIASSFRVLRLLHFIPNIKLILWTVIKSLEIFPWVGFLMMIVFFMFTVIGMQVFSNIRQAPIDEVTQTEITVYNNFANFPQALLVMIRMATGENWQDIMLSCVSGQLCQNSDLQNCGSDFAYFFFPIFYLITSLIILNLLVAVVIDNFDYIVRDRSILGAHQLDLFVKLWSHYDLQAKGYLPSRTVLELMRECNPPVGWGRLCSEVEAYKKMVKMNMKTYPSEDEGDTNLYVSFNGTLFALVRTSLKIHCPGCPECSQKCNPELKKKLKILFPTMPAEKIDEVLPTENDHTVGQEYAALLVQRVWRGYTLKRKRVLDLFYGKNKRTLKAGKRSIPDAGPDLLRRDTSDFEFDLPISPASLRRFSGASRVSYTQDTLSVTGTRSPGVYTTNLFSNIDMDPSLYKGDRYSPVPQSPFEDIEATPRRRRYSPAINTHVTTVDIEPQPRPERSQLRSLEDTREPSGLVTHRRRYSSQSGGGGDPPQPDNSGDNVSELSFTSAYSQQPDTEHTRMETTV